MIEISIESPPSILSWFGYISLYIDGTIYIGKRTSEEIIERVLNHEIIHHSIAIIENQWISLFFDNLFPTEEIDSTEKIMKYIDEYGFPTEACQ